MSRRDVGWHEITVGDGIAVTSEAPEPSPSQRSRPTYRRLDDGRHVGRDCQRRRHRPVAVQEPAAQLEAADPASATASALAPIGLDSAAWAFTDPMACGGNHRPHAASSSPSSRWPACDGPGARQDDDGRRARRHVGSASRRLRPAPPSPSRTPRCRHPRRGARSSAVAAESAYLAGPRQRRHRGRRRGEPAAAGAPRSAGMGTRTRTATTITTTRHHGHHGHDHDTTMAATTTRSRPSRSRPPRSRSPRLNARRPAVAARRPRRPRPATRPTPGWLWRPCRRRRPSSCCSPVSPSAGRGSLPRLRYGVGMALTLCLTGLLLVRAGGLSSTRRGRPCRSPQCCVS